MAFSAQTQGALVRNRNRRITRQILQSLTPWSSGLVVTEGQLVSSENQTSAWTAQSSGTTGATAPTQVNGYSVNDGGVVWVLTDIQSLLQYRYSGAPTP
jgi:hypothetical protein